MKLRSITRQKLFHPHGFTLPELIVTLGILMVLFSVIAISLSYVDQRTASETKTSVVTTDIKGQQIKAMTGDAGSGLAADQGIYFEQNRYVLFRGTTYDANNPTNYAVALASNLEFSLISLPGNQIIFEALSGEVSNYNASTNTVTLRNTTNGETNTLTINSLGTIVTIH